MTIKAYDDLRCREQRIVHTPELLLPQIIKPVGDDLEDIVVNGEKPRRKSLRKLGIDLPSVLNDSSLIKINMFELDRRRSSVSGAGFGSAAGSRSDARNARV